MPLHSQTAAKVYLWFSLFLSSVNHSFPSCCLFFPPVFRSRSSNMNSIHIHRRWPPTPPERGVKKAISSPFCSAESRCLVDPSLPPSPSTSPFLTPLCLSAGLHLSSLLPLFEPPLFWAEGVVLVFVCICHSCITGAAQRGEHRCPHLPHRQQPMGRR